MNDPKIRDDNRLASDASGRPLFEEFMLELGGAQVVIAPTLHLGAFVDWINSFKTSLFQGLRESGVSKKGKGGYQLMTIDVKISDLSAVMLENFEGLPSHICVNQEEVEVMKPKSSEASKSSRKYADKDSDLHRFTSLVDGLVLHIDRNNPPSKTAHHLNELDGDPVTREYAPNQGGYMNVKCKSITVCIHPLNVTTPLAHVSDLSLSGFVYFVALSTSTAGLHPPLYSHIEMSSFSFPSPNRFGTVVESRIRPVKVYSDANVTVNVVDINFGKVMQENMRKFREIVDRLVPPPRDPDLAKLQPAVGWWDNLRFWLHGRFSLTAKVVTYSHLLDSVEEAGRSIQFRSEDTLLQVRSLIARSSRFWLTMRIPSDSCFFLALTMKVLALPSRASPLRSPCQYSTSLFCLNLRNLVLSVPRESYPFMEVKMKHSKERKRSGKERVNASQKDKEMARNFSGASENYEDCSLSLSSTRHNLVLIPYASIKAEITWNVSCPAEANPLQHHSPYTMPLADPKDRLKLFRSTGICLDLDIRISGDEIFKPWLALRVDVLPWFMHHLFGRENDEENEEDGAPLHLDKLKVMAYADEIKCALWRGIYDTDGLCFVIPRVNVISISERVENGDEVEGLVSNSTQIDLGGLKATLLDIAHCYEWEISQEKRSPADGEDREMFKLLQGWHSKITELDYIVEANNVVVLDHVLDDDDAKEGSGTGGAVEDLFACLDVVKENGTLDEEHAQPAEIKEGGGGKQSRSSDTEVHPSIFSFTKNHRDLKPPDACLPIFKKGGAKMMGSESQEKEKVLLRRRGSLGRSPSKRRAMISVDTSFSTFGDGESPNTRESLDKTPRESLDAAPEAEDDDSERTWTVLVAGMKLLWTLNIRDAVLMVIGDLLHTIEMMKLMSNSSRKNGDARAELLKSRSADSANNLVRKSTISRGEEDDTLASPSKHSKHSSLMHLLQNTRGDASFYDTDTTSVFSPRSSIAGAQSISSNADDLERRDTLIGSPTASSVGSGKHNRPPSLTLMSQDAGVGGGFQAAQDSEIGSANSPSGGYRPTFRNGRRKSDDAANQKRRKQKEEELAAKNKYRVKFQLHLTSPQVQVHSKQTSGSVVIAMSGAFVEMRDFVKFVRDNSMERAGVMEDLDISLLKKTEVRYMLDRVEAYAMPTDIDISAGLQWLEVISLEEEKRRKMKRMQEEDERAEKDALARQIERDIAIANRGQQVFTTMNDNLNQSDVASLGSDGSRSWNAGDSSDDSDADSFPDAPKTDVERMFLEERRRSMESMEGSEADKGGNDDEDDVRREPRSSRAREDKRRTSTSSSAQRALKTCAADIHAKTTFQVPILLRKMWEEFTIRSRHVTFTKPLKLMLAEAEAAEERAEQGGAYEHELYSDSVKSDMCTIDSIFVDVPELFFNLDKNQFFTTVDVVRHVLLAPPPAKREYEIDLDRVSSEENNRRNSTSTSSSNEETVSEREGSASQSERNAKWEELAGEVSELLVGNKRGRQRMRGIVQGVLGDLEERCFEAAQVRSIKWGVGKGTWKIQHEGKLDDVEVVFTGLKGTHDFKEDRSMVTNMDLENYFVRSSKPGPQSMEFWDPTSIVRNVLSGTGRAPCQRCGVAFDQEDNDVGSCVFHADEDFMPGAFVRDKNGGRWTCCGATWEGAPGCTSRTHVGKEFAAVATIESLPRLTFSGGEVTIYKHMALNFYPGIRQYETGVQVTSGISDLFMAYFVGEAGDIDFASEYKDAEENGVKSPVPHWGVAGEEDDARKAFLFGDKGNLSMSTSFPRNQDKGKSLTPKDGDNDGSQANESQKDQVEIVYISHLRIGDLRARISTAGFKLVNTDRYKLKVSEFDKVRQVGTWNYLVKKYLRHCVDEVIRSGTKVRRRMIFV